MKCGGLLVGMWNRKRPEITGRRDLTYSRWRRQVSGYDLTYVDVDACEYCCDCFTPLALIETAIDRGREYKSTRVMRRLAEMAGIPAYRVFYTKQGDTITMFRVRQVSPEYDTKEYTMTPAEYEQFLRSLRNNHECRVRRVRENPNMAEMI